MKALVWHGTNDVRVERVPDPAILNPRDTWADKADYDATAAKLVNLFIDNFAKFADHVDQGVKEAAPTAA